VTVNHGNQILATVTASGARPARTVIGSHTYYPFGTELTPTTPVESPLEPHKFTGHERDGTNASSVAHVLDYMHARLLQRDVGSFLIRRSICECTTGNWRATGLELLFIRP
jgi:hypothetical protein